MNTLTKNACVFRFDQSAFRQMCLLRKKLEMQERATFRRRVGATGTGRACTGLSETSFTCGGCGTSRGRVPVVDVPLFVRQEVVAGHAEDGQRRQLTVDAVVQAAVDLDLPETRVLVIIRDPFIDRCSLSAKNAS